MGCSSSAPKEGGVTGAGAIGDTEGKGGASNVAAGAGAGAGGKPRKGNALYRIPSDRSQFQKRQVALEPDRAAAILSTGAEVVMLPFRGKGKPRPRLLYLENVRGTGPRLRWNDGPGTKPATQYLQLSRVTNMYNGQRTPGFRKYARKYEPQVTKSMSLVTHDGGSLDLIMGTVIKKQLWLSALRALLEIEAPTHFPPMGLQPLSPGEIKDEIGDSDGTPHAHHSAADVFLPEDGGDHDQGKREPHGGSGIGDGADGDRKADMGTSAGSRSGGDVDSAGGGGGVRASPTSGKAANDAERAAAAAAAAEAAAAEEARLERERARERERERERKAKAAEEAERRRAREAAEEARRAKAKSDAVRQATAALQGLVTEVRGQLGDAGSYTGVELLSVVRAAANKRAREAQARDQTLAPTPMAPPRRR